jgi:hypothetical protein
MEIRANQEFYYNKSAPVDLKEKNGLVNFTYLVSRLSNENKPLLERGITKISSISGGSKHPLAGIMISTSPHNQGSAVNPWQDVLDWNEGRVEYFGDNKHPGGFMTPGNGLLLEQSRFHLSYDDKERRKAAPLMVFERGRKGVVVFRGYGVIERVQLEEYEHPKQGRYSNFKFSIKLLPLDKNGTTFDWSWVDSRRARDVNNMKSSPESWNMWLTNGNSAKLQT